jgi:hypothetical protein
MQIYGARILGMVFLLFFVWQTIALVSKVTCVEACPSGCIREVCSPRNQPKMPCTCSGWCKELTQDSNCTVGYGSIYAKIINY